MEINGKTMLKNSNIVQVDLTNKNVSVAVVGKDHPFTIYDDAAVDPFLAGVEGEERRGQRYQLANEIKGI